MKLSQYKQDYYQVSTLASGASRQLAFAGIALVWVFKTQGVNGYILPNQLLFPSIFLIGALAADLLQYVISTAIWGIFHRYHELKRAAISEDPDVEAPYYLTWPIIAFFYLKVALVLVAYCLLLSYAITSIEFGDGA